LTDQRPGRLGFPLQTKKQKVGRDSIFTVVTSREARGLNRNKERIDRSLNLKNSPWSIFDPKAKTQREFKIEDSCAGTESSNNKRFY
jgi:hypothetical protein